MPDYEGDFVTVERPPSPKQIAAFWEAAKEVAPGMPSCATCAHWEDIFQQHPRMERGACGLTVTEGDSVNHQAPKRPTLARALAIFPDDADDYRTLLVTDAAFGCAMWEGRG